MAIQGLRDTSNFVADQRPKNWREGILLLQPNGKMPITALTSLMKKRVVDDPEFNWWVKEMQSRRIQLNASITTTTQTTLTLVSGALGLKTGDVLYAEHTGERMFVTADPSIDTEISVRRGWAGSSAQTLTYNGNGVNPFLVVIGSSFEEGSSAPTGVQFDPNKHYNYTQIFRSALEATRTATKTRLRTGDAVKEAKRECLEIFGIDMERAFWLGGRSETTRNGKPLRTMGGIFETIGSEYTVEADTDAGADLSWLEEQMYEVFKYGSSEKMAFCGNRALLTIQQIVRKNSSWEFMQGQKEFGMNVSRLISPFGEIVMKTHPLFNQLGDGFTGGTTATTHRYYGMESNFVILDMENFKYVHLTDSDVKYQPVLQENGLDGMKSGYLGEVSIEIHHPKTHRIIKKLAKAKADA